MFFVNFWVLIIARNFFASLRAETLFFFDAIVWAEICWIFDVNFRSAFWTQKRKKSNNFLVKILLRNVNNLFFWFQKRILGTTLITFFSLFFLLFLIQKLVKGVNLLTKKSGKKKTRKLIFWCSNSDTPF